MTAPAIGDCENSTFWNETMLDQISQVQRKTHDQYQFREKWNG
jgi:hypothetical protein